MGLHERNITYNSYDLQTGELFTSGIVFENLPKREFQTEKYARRDGLTLVNEFFRERMISVQGHIVKDTEDNADTRIDTLKENLIGTEQVIDIDYGGNTRRFYGTLSDLKIPRDRWVEKHPPYVMEFLCVDPFGYATSTTTVSENGITSLSKNKSVSITGSYNPKPVITIDISAASGVTAIAIENTTTGDTITVTRSFSAGETLEIDCDNMTVKVDGSVVDFTGIFPEFNPNSNSLTITTTGTSITYDFSLEYTPTYL